PDPIDQMGAAGAPSSAPTSDTQAPASDTQGPINMVVTDPQTGAQTGHAITSDQLQSLVSQPFDETMKSRDPGSAWDRLVQTLSAAGRSIANTPTPEGGEIGTNIPEQWQARSNPAINPGAAMAGEKVTGNQPGVSPAAQAYNAANPQRQLGSPGEPSVSDYERAYGNSMQSRAGLAGRPPKPQEQAAIDKMNEQGGTPDQAMIDRLSPRGEAQQTETLPNDRTRVIEAALHNPVSEQNQEQEDIIAQNAQQHQQDIAEALMLKNQGINPGNIERGGGGGGTARGGGGTARGG